MSGSRFGHRKEMTSYEDDEDREAQKKLGKDDEEADDELEDSDQEGTERTPASSDNKTGRSKRDLPTVTDDEDDDDIVEDVAVGISIDRKTNTLILRPLTVDPSARPLLMVGLVEKAAEKTLVRSRQKISEAYISDEDGGRGRCLQTAGVNFTEFWRLDRVDHNRLMSNDTWAVRCAYGVEAARANIVDQIRSVFGVYGIEVDPRHLSLIADYMTYDGGYRAMNRIGMADASSSFLQMSFETTANFMVEAALNKRMEHMESPSANIVMGRPVRHGTGAFECLVKAY